MLDGPSVTVVFPAYDEAEGILPAIDDALRALGSLLDDGVVSDFELLVVDDGSTDGTGRLVAERAGSEERLELLTHQRNRGVGAALRTALEVARHQILVYTDADMPVDLGALRQALPLLEDPEVGMVAGHRSASGAEQAYREVASKAFDLFAHLVFGIEAFDVNFPFKVLDVEAARGLGLRSEGALVDVELLARTTRRGRKVVPMAIEYRARRFGRSKTMSTRLLTRLAWETVRSFRSIRRDGA